MEYPAVVAVVLPPTPLAGSLYKPFTEHDGFEEDWWNGDVWSDHAGNTRFVAVHAAGQQVARAELSLHQQPPATYPGWSGPGPFISIEFFEVSEHHRRRGLGTQAMTAIGSLFPGFRLHALSEDADEFWASLGWGRFEHVNEPRNRSLYVSPGATPTGR